MVYRTEPEDEKPEGKNPKGKKPEGEGPYTKLIAFGTIVGVILTYLILAYTVHFWPYSSSNPQATSSPSTTAPSRTAASQATPPVSQPAQINPTVTQSANEVPADYQGTWQGYIVDGEVSDQISMSIGQGADGAQVGEYSNETLGCQATVYLEGGEGPIYLRLVTTSNALNECVPFAYARASLTSGELNLALEDTSEASPDEPASNVMPLAGTLERSS